MGWINVGFAGGYNACVDFPFSLFYKELLEAIPDAKVLLTVRDHGDTWNKSVYDTIYGIERNRGLFLRLVTFFTFSPILGALDCIWGSFLQGSMEDKSKAIALYNQHIEEVKKTVPARNCLCLTSPSEMMQWSAS